MKLLQKIIALTAALTVMISIFNITSYATSETSAMTVQEFYSSQSFLVDKWVNGDITYAEWYEQQNAVLEEFYSTNQSIGDANYATALAIGERYRGISQKIGKAVEQWGDSARERVADWWNDICNKHNVPTSETQTSTTDFMGYGAKIEYYTNGKLTGVYFCDYMTVYPDRPADQNNIRTNGVISCYSVKSNGDLEFNYNLNVQSWYRYPADTSGSNFQKFYGDIRYSDGTPAPSDDVFEYGTLKNFDDMSAKDIEDLLDDFSEEMERQNPDLSNVEGLLNAIYARLGKLDSDDDGAMLSAINAAIISLAADNKASSAELIEVLKELKQKETEGGDLKPVLDELDKINKSLDYLKTINTLDLIGDTIDSLLELTDTERTFLDTYAGLILNLTAKLGYAPVTVMIDSLEAIMLNGNPPQDIAINIYDTQVVLLSSSIFEDTQIAEALSLAKLFVSMLLAISWLYAMRKKITGGA